MRKYELMLILNPEMGDEGRTALLQEIKEELAHSSKATIEKEEVWGVKTLAYKINNSTTGFYILLTLGLEGGDFFAVTKSFNLKKDIWRSMFVRLDIVKANDVDYKDPVELRTHITKFNKIIPRYYSNVALKDQRKVAQAIKRARYMALLPYVLNVRTQVAAPVVVAEVITEVVVETVAE